MFAGVPPDQFAAAVAADDRPAYRIDPDMLVVGGVTWSDFFLRHRELLRHNLKSQPLTADQRALIEPMLAMPARTAQWIADTQPSLTEDEQRSHFSLWAMLGAPLLAGNDLRAMSPTTLSILTNREVIAVDQDPLLAKPPDRRRWADLGQATRRLLGGGRPVQSLECAGGYCDHGRRSGTAAGVLLQRARPVDG